MASLDQKLSLDQADRALLLVADPLSDGSVSGLLLASAGPLLEQDPLELLRGVNPGVYRVRLSHQSLQELVRVFSELGYGWLLYHKQDLKTWLTILENLVEQPFRSELPDLVALGRQLPPHRIQVDLFGGLPSATFTDPVSVEVYNDHAGLAVDFFRALRDPQVFYALLVLTRIFPLSMAPDGWPVREFLANSSRDPKNLPRLVAWYGWASQAYRQAFSSLAPTAKGCVGEEELLSKALRVVDPYLPQLHGRLIRLQYEHNDPLKVLELFDSTETLFWVDIPLDQHPDAVKAVLTNLGSVSGQVAVFCPVVGAHPELARWGAALPRGWKHLALPASNLYTRHITSVYRKKRK